MKNCLKGSFICCGGVHGRCRKVGPPTVAVDDGNRMRAAGGSGDSVASVEQAVPKVICDEELNKPRTEGSPVRGAEDTVHDRRVPRLLHRYDVAPGGPGMSGRRSATIHRRGGGLKHDECEEYEEEAPEFRRWSEGHGAGGLESAKQIGSGSCRGRESHNQLRPRAAMVSS